MVLDKYVKTHIATYAAIRKNDVNVLIYMDI